jgi:hypothetical protein
MNFHPIVLNKAKCTECGDILISEDSNKWEECSCGQLKITGGHFYVERVGKHKELSKGFSVFAEDTNEELLPTPEEEGN